MKRLLPALPTRGVRRQERGFTLVEFMVALTGGLFVSIAIFTLAKHSSRFYQRELRVGNATLSSMVGFERLRADIARAGYMASPNIQKDPTVCGDATTYPGYMSQLTSVHIADIATVPIVTVPAIPPLPAVYAANSLAPQRITLVGNYSSVDQFPVRLIHAVGGTGYEVYLQAGPDALELASIGSPQAAALTALFRVGRVARVVDKRGAAQFGLITEVTGGANPVVTLGEIPELKFMATSGPLNCGFHGHETGSYINPVDIIRYDLRSLSGDDRYDPVYANTAVPFESDRLELIREEVDPGSTASPPAAFAGTQELIAEYAMDLRFQLTVAPTDTDALLVVPAADVIGNTEIISALNTWAGKPSDHTTGRGPQLIRNIRTWFSVRSREADRIDAASLANAGGPLLRVALGESGGPPFARVRTVQSYIALRNQIGVTWQ